MSERMFTVATFGTTIEAELAKNRLESEGIRAYLGGEETTGLFAGLGHTFGGIRLLVADEHQERASALLASPAERDEAQAGQDSTAIEEHGPAGRATGRPRPPLDTAIQAPPTREGPSGCAEEPDLEFATADEERDEEAEEEDADRAVAWTAEKLASRSLRAALLGLVLCPPLLHLYSLWLLYRLMSLPDELSPAGTRKVYAALAIDGLVVISSLLFAAILAR